MIDANKGANEETLRRLRDESLERLCLELLKSIEQLLTDFEMTWDDLAEKLGFSRACGPYVKSMFGGDAMDVCLLNSIAHIFSTEPYIIFRPRFPWTGS